MRIPTLEEDPDTIDLLNPGDLLPDKDGSFLRRFHRKVNRVRGLDLRRKQDKSCGFYCQPATHNHESGVGSSLTDSVPSVKIYIHHCLRCLRKKGHMDKVTEYRMGRRDTFATPSSQVTSSNVKANWSNGNKNTFQHHAVFGGWLSQALDKVENKHRQADFYSVNTRRSRKLLARSVKPRRFQAVTKKAVIIGKQIEDDYVNNYEDVPSDEDLFDFEKVEENTRTIISDVLLGVFIFFAVFFIIIFPIASFFSMCCKDFRGNLSLVGYILCCRDPKYKLVKELCERKNLFIPKYRRYNNIMKKYKDVAEKKVNSVDSAKSTDVDNITTESSIQMNDTSENTNTLYESQNENVSRYKSSTAIDISAESFSNDTVESTESDILTNESSIASYETRNSTSYEPKNKKFSRNNYSL
ncbi:hypothetical protein JTE90_007505 [Oedothorax gibbosus]|nr:hypothetical protein JTE90_007505 [Oedothorax gibbosus]